MNAKRRKEKVISTLEYWLKVSLTTKKSAWVVFFIKLIDKLRNSKIRNDRVIVEHLNRAEIKILEDLCIELDFV